MKTLTLISVVSILLAAGGAASARPIDVWGESMNGHSVHHTRHAMMAVSATQHRRHFKVWGTRVDR